MDAQLHLDRLTTSGAKKTYRDDIAALADGVFIVHEGEAWLLWQSEMLHWTPGGYDRRMTRPTHGHVAVLTPQASTRVIGAGYTPAVHPSAQRDATAERA
jgi:hypothetical protein